MAIMAALPKPNPFVSPPPKPNINDPAKPLPPLPIPIPKYRPPPPPKPTVPPSPALKSFHRRTHYRRPIPSSGLVSSEPDGRSVVLGDSGLSYLLPGAPFEFQFSYSETPKARPLAIREPAFLPFAPPSMARPWTGKPPLKKPNRKKVPLVSPLCPPRPDDTTSPGPKVLGVRTPLLSYGRYPSEKKTRGEILGRELNRQEIRDLVRPHLSSNRQVNLGRDGLTHNMLELVHTHWRRDQVCKVRCRGVPTVDMNNICRHLEEKTGGKIIHRIGGVVYLFRGRNYDQRSRPQYPIMLWKPAAPVYPKLIQEAPEGLTKAEADELRRKGENLLPICKLAKNGIYMNLVKDVRQAFESSSLVKINCQGMHATDYKKLGAKLKELVPCVLLSFDEEQILMWRGRDWKSMYHSVPSNSSTSSSLISSGNQGGIGTSGAEASKKSISSSKMVSLWKRAIESNKALLLNESENNLCPDALLQKVEEFASLSQAEEHSFPAVVVNYPSSAQTENEGDGPDFGLEGENELDSMDNYNDNDDFTDYSDDDKKSFVPWGSLPVDSLAERLDSE